MVSGTGGTPFESTARVLRARLDRVAQKILAHLTDATFVKGGRTVYPELSMRELSEISGYSITTVQRKLRLLEAAKLVRRFVRPGRSYVWQPLVDQLAL